MIRELPATELRCLSPESARRFDYIEITTPISLKSEPQVFQSVQDSLRGLDAVWIEYPGERFAAGRRVRDLLAVEELVDDDDRRSGKSRKRKGASKA